MTHESAVEFPTPTRVHMGLAVRDVSRATGFYQALFGQPPTKERTGYAKFEVFDPPLNLSLNEHADAQPASLPQHFGIQVKHRAAIAEIAARMAASGYEGETESQVSCCYAVQDKIWLTDPDGHRWELFIVTKADSPHLAPSFEGQAADASACCGPASAVEAGAGTSTPIDASPDPPDASADADASPCCAPTCCS